MSDNLPYDRKKRSVCLLTFFANSITIACGIGFLIGLPSSASDWDEDSGSDKNNKQKPAQTQAAPESEYASQPPPESASQSSSDAGADSMSSSSDGKKPLEGKIEKSHDSLRIQRKNAGSGELQSMPLPEGTQNLDAKAIDDELRGMVNDGSLKGLQPALDNSRPLAGRAELQGGKGTKGLDPDEDDTELLVEWDRWHNRFLRAVQLGTQENVNNPDPDDYERPRVDPRTGMISSRYPLGTGAAFSCIVTDDGQIKNLEIFETSGFPKYDKAVLRAVQQLAGTHILKFPKGSHRKTVMQPGRIKTATQADFKYHHFGDVERIHH